MKELKKDLFECISDPNIDTICITTNQHYTRGGLAVMGGGCAAVAAKRWPEVQKRLGMLLKQFGTNVPFVIGALDEDGNHIDPTAELIKNKNYKCLVFSFPTINDLINGANINLIKQSATIMNDYADQYDLKGIVIGRPGAGIGGLDYHTEVKPAIQDILDDRFIIVSFPNEQ